MKVFVIFFVFLMNVNLYAGDQSHAIEDEKAQLNILANKVKKCIPKLSPGKFRCDGLVFKVVAPVFDIVSKMDLSSLKHVNIETTKDGLINIDFRASGRFYAEVQSSDLNVIYLSSL